jgi:hypothetical protein
VDLSAKTYGLMNKKKLNRKRCIMEFSREIVVIQQTWQHMIAHGTVCCPYCRYRFLWLGKLGRIYTSLMDTMPLSLQKFQWNPGMPNGGGFW